jgi:hypothetical protein
MSQMAQQSSIQSSSAAPIPPLENGDHLTCEEFEKRYDAMPGLKKAELIDGRVHLAHEFPRTTNPSHIHPLENGDHLTIEEFERRYDAMPGLKKAELIDGRVYVAPPVRYFPHSVPHFQLVTLLGVYCASSPGTSGGDNGSMRLDHQSMFQPDLCLLVLPSHGGSALAPGDTYVAGAPELIAEIAASSVSFDLHDKLDRYAHAGVREYIVWRTLDKAIDYLILRAGKYVPLAAADGVFKSEVFPGLWIDSRALFAGDLAKALGTVQQGIASPEHLNFVAALAARAAAVKS